MGSIYYVLFDLCTCACSRTAVGPLPDGCCCSSPEKFKQSEILGQDRGMMIEGVALRCATFVDHCFVSFNLMVCKKAEGVYEGVCEGVKWQLNNDIPFGFTSAVVVGCCCARSCRRGCGCCACSSGV